MEDQKLDKLKDRPYMEEVVYTMLDKSLTRNEFIRKLEKLPNKDPEDEDSIILENLKSWPTSSEQEKREFVKELVEGDIFNEKMIKAYQHYENVRDLPINGLRKMYKFVKSAKKDKEIISK